MRDADGEGRHAAWWGILAFLVSVCFACGSLLGEDMHLVSEWITCLLGSKDCTGVKYATLRAIMVWRISLLAWAPLQVW